jgi:hypothetical protein
MLDSDSVINILSVHPLRLKLRGSTTHTSPEMVHTIENIRDDATT